MQSAALFYVIFDKLDDALGLGTPPATKSSFFLNIVQKGEGGRTHVYKDLLQILYHFEGYLVV